MLRAKPDDDGDDGDDHDGDEDDDDDDDDDGDDDDDDDGGFGRRRHGDGVSSTCAGGTGNATKTFASKTVWSFFAITVVGQDNISTSHDNTTKSPIYYYHSKNG